LATVKADNQRAAVCATRPSDNASRSAESYEFVTQALKTNIQNLYKKNLQNWNLFTSNKDFTKNS